MGTKLQEELVNDRIKKMKVSFYYPIKKNKLKTFSTNTWKISSKTEKALAKRNMLNRVLAAREFAQGHQSQWVLIFLPVTRCTVIIFIGWIPDTSLKELLFFSLPHDALSLSSLNGSRTPVSKSCDIFPCHPMHCHYLHWMDPGHQSQRFVIFFPVTRWLSLSSLDGSRTSVSKSCYLFPCHMLHCHYLYCMDPYIQNAKLLSSNV